MTCKLIHILHLATAAVQPGGASLSPLKHLQQCNRGPSFWVGADYSIPAKKVLGPGRSGG